MDIGVDIDPLLSAQLLHPQEAAAHLQPHRLMAGVDFKANGEVSRMRNHKGNMPSLPQTKHCPLCPAKFTRTTHLNRHLRSHTNERLHRCNICNAEFTRSDLLTRHKRTCGDTLNANRSRRKSCQACAESKVKCNLHHPCSKCISRGRECVFINDPETSRMKKQLSSSAKRKLSLISTTSSSSTTSPSSISAGPSPSTSPSASLSSLFSDNSSVSPSLNGSQSPDTAELESEFSSSLFFAPSSSLPSPSASVPPLSVSPGSSSSSLSTSPPSEFLDPQGLMGSTVNVAFDAYSSYGMGDSAGNGMGYFEEYGYEYAQAIDPEGGFGGYLGPTTSEATMTMPVGDCGTIDSITGDFDAFSWIGMDVGTNEYYTTGFGATNTPATITALNIDFPRGFHDAPVPDMNVELGLAAIGTAQPIPTSPRTSQVHVRQAETAIYDPFLATSSSSAGSVPVSLASSTSEDLDGYMNHFFLSFNVHFPLVHVPTFLSLSSSAIEGGALAVSNSLIPPILIRAMQACGALFARTPESVAFVEETLASTRDVVLMELANLLVKTERETEDLLLTVVLLQTIALFHEKSEQRVKGNVYHGMLVMMIRRIGLIQRVNAWVPPDVAPDNAQILDVAWRAWARHETIKRVLFLTYLHDTCHPIYFSLPSSLHPSEMDLCLPCDEALWGGKDATAWYAAAYGCVSLPSLSTYGIEIDRGVAAYAVEYGVGPPRLCGFPMQRARTLLQEPKINQNVLRLNPFACFVVIHSILGGIYTEHADSPQSSSSGLSNSAIPANGDSHVYALHNWLQTWLGSPESLAVELSSPSNPPPFVHDALPFYWLAQIAINGDSVLGTQNGDELRVQGGKVAVHSTNNADERAENRFWTVKRWLDRIRSELRSGAEADSEMRARKGLWDELSRIRQCMGLGRATGAENGKDHPDGLLAFFQSSSSGMCVAVSRGR